MLICFHKKENIMPICYKKLLAKLCVLGALCALCVPNLMAQGDDPFNDEFDYTKYQSNMTVTGYVRMVTLVNGVWTPVNEGEVLGNETVVAAYCGDELRGKGNPANFNNNKYISLLRLTVYGENKDKLYFKVFTNGHVIEVDQGVTFTEDGYGKAKEPYYINLPAPITTTFNEDGWATTCLPFDARVPEGVTIWVVTGIEDGNLIIEEVVSDVLPKDTPVLIQSDGQASCEWLSAVIDKETLAEATSLFKEQASILKGTTEPTGVEANSVLTFGYSEETSELGFWLNKDTTIPANQAYITDFPADSQGAKLVTDTTTGISEIENGKLILGSPVYDLQGRRIESTVLRKGIYVVNGKKTIIK